MKTELYDDLGAGYDLIINWQARLARETPFYRELFAWHQVDRLLDVGCGTGQHARLFAEWGIAVVGADPSEAMLARAREVTQGLPVTLAQAGFRELESLCDTPFPAVLCLGNTLPHAVTPAERQQALRAFAACLAPGGVCVIQTLNYDQLAASGERFQPLAQGVVDGQEQLLLRMFDFGPETWQFNILRFTRPDGKWQFDVSSTRHLPVFGESLRQELLEAGFTQVRLLGDFDGSPYVPETAAMLLAVAEKG